MRKIPTLYRRDFSRDHGRYVTDEVLPGCEWVLAGEGVATRKFDGTAVALLDLGQDPNWTSGGLHWWVRREVKPHGDQPYGFHLIGVDPETGKEIGWMPAERDGRWSQLQEAIERHPNLLRLQPGTYELVGPKVNRNPEHADGHMLIPHGQSVIPELNTPTRTREQIAAYLAEHPGVEGVVFWERPGDLTGLLAKIKARDFRPASQPSAAR